MIRRHTYTPRSVEKSAELLQFAGGTKDRFLRRIRANNQTKPRRYRYLEFGPEEGLDAVGEVLEVRGEEEPLHVVDQVHLRL